MTKRFRSHGRTPLFSLVKRALNVANYHNKNPHLSVSEILERQREYKLSRRQFLKGLGATTLLAGSGALNSACGGGSHSKVIVSSARVAIVGAGVAGLNAAYTLQKSGVDYQIFEAATRSGGRMYTASNLVGAGITTELGGEFIDSIHEEMLALAQEFGLELIDTLSPSEAGLSHSYFFDGAHYTEAQIIEAFIPLALQISADYDSLGDIVDFENEGGGTELDNTSIAEYLDRIGATGFVRKLLEVAYVTEYGLNADQQSSINLIFLISTDTSDGFEIFGDSDERYKIKGGNERIVQELAARLDNEIQLEHRLEAVRQEGTGYVLTFRAPGGSREVHADIVILCLPFTLLRSVDLQVDLFPAKMKAIQELGYGTNAKVFAGFERPIWREQGSTGDCFSDELFQLCWDSSRLQGISSAAGITFYSGGALGLDAGKGDAAFQVNRLMRGFERVFPGANGLLNGNVGRFHWPSHPFTKASYACYKPGQWTTIAGAEIKPVGNLYFAGEHCSYDFQGYMNGGAETGRAAAEAILFSLGLPISGVAQAA